MKKCRKCGEHKALKEFYHVQGYHNICSSCRTAPQKLSQPAVCIECNGDYIRTQPAQKYCGKKCNADATRKRNAGNYSEVKAREYYRRKKGEDM